MPTGASSDRSGFMDEITQKSQWEQSFETDPLGRSKIGQAVGDGGPLSPDHLRTMKSQTATKEEPWL